MKPWLVFGAIAVAAVALALMVFLVARPAPSANPGGPNHPATGSAAST